MGFSQVLLIPLVSRSAFPAPAMTTMGATMMALQFACWAGHEPPSMGVLSYTLTMPLERLPVMSRTWMKSAAFPVMSVITFLLVLVLAVHALDVASP